MDLHNINTIARYEVKLLRRSWLFRIFATLALLGITLSVLLLLTPLINTYSAQWPLRAVSSQIPYFSTALYNIAQSIIVVFLAGSFLKRDRKLDTAEVIYVRPMSNADYIIGKTWGIVKVFLALQAIVLLITLFLHVTLTQSPFSIFPYVFYLFTVSLPSLLFMLGLSYTAMCLLKNQAVTFVVMLGLVGLEFFYIKDSCYGVFDFFGRNIPALFSDVTGHVDLPHFLLQRFIYLTAGIGLICFTIALVKRLPHRPWKLVVVHSLGVAFVVIALAAGLLYVRHYHQLNASRQEYIATFNRYANAPRVNICKNDLSITPSGNRLEGESRMELENRSGQRIEEIVLYLNPSLSVQSAANEQGTMTYHRERQVIVLKHALNPGEKTTVTLHYQGGIDEAICYTDILEKDYWDNTDPQHTFSLGKQYAWLEEDFTLLTPECLWYPVAIPPVNPEAPYNLLKDFTHYTLTVNYDGGKTVLSQGEAEQQAGKTVFRNRTALPCISLTIADYDKKSLRVDSVDYEILYFKGHDYFSSHFALLQDTLPGLIRELKNDKETKQGRDYPFRRFTLAETPAQHHSYVRNWKGHTEYVLPEIVFIPERGIRLNSDFQSAKIRTESWLSHREGNPAPLEVTISVFNNFLQNTLFEEITQYERDWSQKYVNQFSARPLFYHHAGFIRANDYPILDISLNMMQDNDVELRGPFWLRVVSDAQRANLYLESHSFAEAISDQELKPAIFYELLKLKSRALKNYVNTQISEEEFTAFLKDFFRRHSFTETSFATFKQEFSDRYGLNLEDFVQRWYYEDHTPSILIKNVDAKQTVIDEVTKYQIHFKAYNPSDVDAILTTEVQQGGAPGRGPRGGRGGFRGGNGASSKVVKHHVLPAREAMEVKIITDERPSSVSINTNISCNLPSLHMYPFSKVDQETKDTLSGCFTIDPQEFSPAPNELIVDNEEKGFRTIASNNRNKLKDLLQQPEEEKYSNFSPWNLASKWRAIAGDYCYGDVIQSAVYKKKGSGNNSVEWSTEIPHDHYYEVYVWINKIPMPGPFRRRQEQEEHNQTYTIRYGEEEESITIDIAQEEESGWVSLGNFYLPQGNVSITLTDKVTGRYVIADAVKFTRTN